MIYINKQLCQHIKFKIDENIKYFYKIENTKLDDNSFYFGTISDIKYLKKNNYYNYSEENCDILTFLPFIKENYLNFDGFFIQVCQLKNLDMSKKWFCRSNSGDKVWSGQYLDVSNLNIIQNTLQDDDLLYIAPYKNLIGEIRCWCINEKVIEYSPYQSIDCNFKYHFGELNIGEVLNYVNKINDYWTPGEMFTIDICKVENQLKIVEYNGFSTSGFYEADINKICKNLKNYI